MAKIVLDNMEYTNDQAHAAYYSNDYLGIEFDGSDDRVTCGTADVVNLGQAMTFSCWIYTHSLGGGSLGRIFSKRNTAGTNTGFSILVTSLTGSSFAVGLNVDGAAFINRSSTQSFTINTWCNLTVTWDGSATGANINIYLNGSDVSTGAGGNGSSNPSFSGYTNWVGNRESLNRGFDGVITELAIWNKILSSGQITSLATFDRNVPATIEPSNLQLYLPMNDGVVGASAHGATVVDRSGNSRNGTGDYGAGATGLTWVGNLNSFSESSIKTQGSYALKGIAPITGSLNETFTYVLASPINLTGVNLLKFDIYASRTGSNLKIGIHDAGGTTTETTPNITGANAWQTVTLDISAVSDANKDAIDKIIVTVVNADAANTFYIDNFGITTNFIGCSTNQISPVDNVVSS